MPQRFFELFDDVGIPGRWELGHLLGSRGQPLEEPWRFRLGERTASSERIRIDLQVSGKPLDFSLADFSTPVVHARVAPLLVELAPDDVQLVPVDIDSRREEYFILNATRVIRCIDDKASKEVKYWKPEDGRPEKTGHYRAVYGMRIDASQAGDAQVFRPWGWTVALIVSEEIKQALERSGATGAKFKEV